MAEEKPAEEKPPLPRVLEDFLHAVRPDPKTGPVEEMKLRAEQQAANVGSQALPLGGGARAIDQIVEIRIRQWMEQMKATAGTPADGAGSRKAGRGLNFFPPRR